MERIYYYHDELEDDFACTRIKVAKLPQDYKYVRTDKKWRVCRFLVYKVIATPLVFFITFFTCRIKNKKVLRGCKRKDGKKCGAFIYGNHTAYLSDALLPTRIAFPRMADVVVNPDAVSLKGIGGLVRILGGVPVARDMHGLKRFSDDVISAAEGGRWVAIYPEAHIWPYYTGIRPFGSASFKYPAKCGAPVFAYTTTYKKRMFSRKPKRVVYIDGPFYADESLGLKARAESLRGQVYAAMCRRSQNSNCCYADYYKVENAQLAAALNGAQAAACARGRKYKKVRGALAECVRECNEEFACLPGCTASRQICLKAQFPSQTPPATACKKHIRTHMSSRVQK